MKKESQQKIDERGNATSDMASSSILSESDDASQNKIMAIVAYFVFFAPLLDDKKSSFALYHANQGLLLLITAVVIHVATSIITIGANSFLLGSVISLVGILFIIALLVKGVLHASHGEKKPLPIIGELTTFIKSDI